MTDTYRALQSEMANLEKSLMSSPSTPSPGAEQQNQQQVQQQAEETPSILPSFLQPQTEQRTEPQQQTQEATPAKPLNPYEDDVLADLYADPTAKTPPASIPYERFKQVNDEFSKLKGYRDIVQEIEEQYGGLEGLREARERQAEQEREAYEKQLSQTHEAKARETVQKLIDSNEVSETIGETLTGILTRALQAETMDKERQTQYQQRAFQQAEAKLLEKFPYAEPLAIRAALKEAGEKGAEQIARQSHNRVQTYLAKAAPPPAAVQQMQGVPVPQGRGQAAVQSQTLTVPNPGDGVQAFKDFAKMEANLDAQFRQQEAKKLRDARRY